MVRKLTSIATGKVLSSKLQLTQAEKEPQLKINGA
jgi:hypothetical protein